MIINIYLKYLVYFYYAKYFNLFAKESKKENNLNYKFTILIKNTSYIKFY